MTAAAVNAEIRIFLIGLSPFHSHPFQRVHPFVGRTLSSVRIVPMSLPTFLVSSVSPKPAPSLFVALPRESAPPQQLQRHPRPPEAGYRCEKTAAEEVRRVEAADRPASIAGPGRGERNATGKLVIC